MGTPARGVAWWFWRIADIAVLDIFHFQAQRAAAFREGGSNGKANSATPEAAHGTADDLAI
jgi:hypothetical protein